MQAIRIERETACGITLTKTQCPFLKFSYFNVGSKDCIRCKFNVNYNNDMVWCIGDEH